MKDYEANREIDRNINDGVRWYLMSAYGYYVLGAPIVSDYFFDQLALKLRRVWDKIEHKYKDLITEDDLWCGTLLLSEEKYPKDIIEEYEKIAKDTDYE